MANSESAIYPTLTFTSIDKICRQIFISLMQTLPEGYLVIKENDAVVAQCGNSNSDLHAEVNIHSPKTYRKLLFGGSVASGETYTDGMWSSPELTHVIRLFARNLPTLDRWESRFSWLTFPFDKIMHLKRRNTRDQAKKNIAAHYDLGNTLYTHFLDKSMMYSSAIYPDANASLAEAQQYKLKTICDKLQLNESDHLVEIGTGWGGLAVFAAKHYGCKVTTTTISEEQFAYASEWVKKEGLENQVTLLKKDYRLLEGKFSKLVSIEMIEAVGKPYLNEFFTKCASLLKPDGLMLLQSIIIDDRRYDTYQKGVDFIQKHIFPGGFLPSQLTLNDHIKRASDLSIRDLHDIGLDYATTLRDWFEAFNAARPALAKHGYDDRFARMWEYYLKYCEGGFLERTISTVQLVLSKPRSEAKMAR
ncbi:MULTISPECIES: cyclopropane-fatty-acyl-phospholipid synthase family protein [Marisediminitalea]|jgi:cyclopropane-fatty-acyl-phospholipid synthase|uniref:SAM-dependent methyltransferase n=1 Tax=Marisediminitalea TaxID=2662254 RepID=UPI0020CE7D01|nr:cyclopropane-fatty-acyl-phospholipid synthase family protein [Marisediminitalea aggregata]MCP3865632.1 class I SAM-dependent methyltransferase [Aestuariibacter sp.]MCP4238176.1 class I SAM-dependent methyltransferase [Aestuariibacter sp.]MCP4525540.1 class I SAM-dependent methyltransferase [Aestuariibacter sp.]MCP4949922.1 class I SAM-dependent methyltransferase [Aestuariibacter sp.]MCP5012499.1 class I SAM-dependent methyltransferase [Aestuariibacter sp.]